MALAVIGLGSNLGDRRQHLDDAIHRMAAVGTVQRASRFYETDALTLPGAAAQPAYLNAALLLSTEQTPQSLVHGLLDIEQQMGRVRRKKWEPRIIDLDLLLYDTMVMTTGALTIPHPELAHRHFVLEPLCEIAPDLVHPVLGQTIQTLLQRALLPKL